MGRRKVLYVLPRLNDCGGNLDAEWYIEYSFRDDKNSLKRFRVYEGLKSLSTEEERRAYASKIIEDITNKIKRGWTPFDLDKVVCNNHIAYNLQSRVYGSTEKTPKNLFFYINAFLEEKSPTLKPKTLQDYTSKLRILHQWLYSKGVGNIFAQELTNEQLTDFIYYLINERNLERRTILDFTRRISQLYHWMIKKQILNYSPVSDLPSGRQKTDHSAQPMTKDDAKSLLDYIKNEDSQVYLFCAMIFYCAIRPGTELRLLKVKDINFFTNTITIRIENGKTGEGIINMPPKIVKILKSFKVSTYNREYYLFGKDGKPGEDCWGKNHFRLEFNKHRDALGYPSEYKLYSWKCTGAILFAMSGAPLPAIRDHCRHKSTAYTDIYLSKKIGKQNDYVKHKFPEL